MDQIYEIELYSGWKLAQLVKCLIVEQEIGGSILAYTKNQLVSWFDDKKLSLEVDVIGWNSLKKKKMLFGQDWVWADVQKI